MVTSSGAGDGGGDGGMWSMGLSVSNESGEGSSHLGSPTSALRRPVMVSTPPMSRSMPALLGLNSMKASRMRTVEVSRPMSAAERSCTTCVPAD